MAIFNKGKKNQTGAPGCGVYMEMPKEQARPSDLQMQADPIAAAISERRKKIADLFSEIGMAYFNSHVDDPEASEREKIEQVIALNHEIEDYEDSIKAANGLTVCRSCGRDIVLDAVFCSYCGAQVEHPKNKQTRFCSNCGAVMNGGQKYCVNCGAAVKEYPEHGFGVTEEKTEAETGYSGEYKEEPSAEYMDGRPLGYAENPAPESEAAQEPAKEESPAPEKAAVPDYSTYYDPDGSFETVMLFDNEPAAVPDVPAAFDESAPEPAAENINVPEPEKAPEPLRKKDRVCARCGQKIEDDSSFCIYCGTKVESDNNYGAAEPLHMAQDIPPTTALFDTEPDKNPYPDDKPVKICRICGSEIDPGSDFCLLCGAKAQDDTPAAPSAPAKICRICGAELKEGMVFCTNCGGRI